jgi:hypothetical protein
MTTHEAGIKNGEKQATGSLTDNDGGVWRMLDSAMHIDDDSDVMHCVRGLIWVRGLIRVSIGCQVNSCVNWVRGLIRVSG